MPGPAVYIVAVVGVVAVGFAFKEFVFDPYVKPQLETWREEQRLRREAKKRLRQPISPHTNHRAPAPLSKAASTHEMKDLGSSATGASGLKRGFPTNTSNDLRVRHSNLEVSDSEDMVIERSGFMDIPNDKSIAVTPLIPELNPWSSAQAPRSPTLTPSRSPFSVGSDSPMTLSSPRSGVISLGASQPSPSPRAPRVQLPTPSESEDEMKVPSSREVHLIPLQMNENRSTTSTYSHLSAPSAGSAAFNHQAQVPAPGLRPDLYAQPISRTTTDMSASFFTAQSPGTEFRSFPPTEPTSPFSEAFTLSGDEDMYSFSSHSDADETRPLFDVPADERHGDDIIAFVVGNVPSGRVREELSDSLSDTSEDASSGCFSDESWSEFSAPPTSPRH